MMGQAVLSTAKDAMARRVGDGPGEEEVNGITRQILGSASQACTRGAWAGSAEILLLKNGGICRVVNGFAGMSIPDDTVVWRQ